ncbi:MAG: hypothetical protein D6714_11080 [Bacteroidetes bacterium]|nr:MAG: hypothetical protein D6714_11080 [Bacteroidota bacterium]
MDAILKPLIIALFVALLFVNVYFRIKVLKSHKILVRNRVEFGAKHIFSRQKLEEEILPKYPHMEKEILTFVNHLNYSIKMASVLIAVITLFGAILMYYRN